MSLTRAAWLALPFALVGLAVAGGVLLLGGRDESTWTLAGRHVDRSLIRSEDGSICELRSAAFVRLGPALARRYGSKGPFELAYYKDSAKPEAAFRVPRLPRQARDTGLREGGRALWISPAELPAAVYLVQPRRVERWPRVDFGCA